MKALRLAAFTFIFIGISGLAEEQGTSFAKWDELRGKLFSSGEESETLEKVAIPHLISKTLSAEWGKPEMWVLEEGSYGVRYRNPDPDSPFEVLTILGFATPIAPLASVPNQSFDEIVNEELTTVKRPQKWKSVKVSIAGVDGGKQKLRYFREYAGGGADGPRDSTDTFTLTVSGKTGHYIVIIDTITDATKKRLKALSVE